MVIFKALQKFWNSCIEKGISETFFHILHRLRIISVLHSFNFTLKELDVRDGVLIMNSFDDIKNPKICQINGFSITLREIKLEELENLIFANEIFSVETFREHFSHGMRFFAAFHEGIVVSVNGIHTKYAYLPYIKRPVVQLPDGVTYLNCAKTSPSHRSLGIGTVLRTFLLGQLWREGYHSTVAAVFTDNDGALRWNLTNGFKHWGRISYIQWQRRDVWIKRLTKLGRQCPYLLDHVVTAEDSPATFPMEVMA